MTSEQIEKLGALIAEQMKHDNAKKEDASMYYDELFALIEKTGCQHYLLAPLPNADNVFRSEHFQVFTCNGVAYPKNKFF